MAKARTALTLNLAWSGTLEILNHDMAGCAYGGGSYDALEPPIKGAFFSALGATLAIQPWPTAGDGGPPVQADSSQYVPPMSFMSYYVFTVKVSAGMMPMVSQEKQVGLKFGMSFPMGGIPTPCILQPDGNMSIPFTYQVTGLYGKGEVVERSHANRELMDLSDLLSQYAWVSDGNSHVTLTATLPDNSMISVTNALGWAAGEVDVTAALGAAFGFSAHTMYIAGLPYARLSDLKFNGVAIDTSLCELYQTGTDIPDGTQPAWGRTAPTPPTAPGYGDNRIGDNGGGVAIWSGGSEAHYAWGITSQWTGRVGVPGHLKLVPHCGEMDDRVEYPALQFTSQPIDWSYSGGAWHSTPTVFGPEGIERRHRQVNWEFKHEWQKLDGAVQAVYQLQSWRETAGENVGATVPANNDAQCGLIKYPITASVLTGNPFWSPFATLQHAAAVSLNDPANVETRPSLWVGETGVTVSPSDNDVWHIAAGTTAPRISRSLVTWFWQRMARLGDLQDDPAKAHNQDWPIINRANVSLGDSGDDSDWRNPALGGHAAEDITNAAEYAYLGVHLDSPRAGAITIKLTASKFSFDDPCTTCFEHRYGLDGTWYFTREGNLVATYRGTLAAGENQFTLDLCLPAEKFTPCGALRLQHLDSLEVTLPDNTGVESEQYTLHDVTLEHDPGTFSWGEPDAHIMARVVRNWAWLPGRDEDGNPVWGGNDGDGHPVVIDWFGIGAWVDGKECLELDYGFEHSNGMTRHEQKILYLQHRKHCPLDEEQSSMLDTAKTLGRICTEIGWQEGWTATLADALNSAQNKDGDGNLFAKAIYPWDVRQGHEFTGQEEIVLDGAICVGWGIGALPGIEDEQHFYAYPRGRVAGLAYNKARTKRLRNEQSVHGYEREVAGSWAALAVVTPNIHGRYQLEPARELNREYSLGADGKTAWAALTVANREYSFAEALIGGGVGPNATCIDPLGNIWRASIVDDTVQVFRLGALPDEWWVPQGTSHPSGTWGRPTIVHKDDASVMVGSWDGTRLVWKVLRERSGADAVWEAV